MSFWCKPIWTTNGRLLTTAEWRRRDFNEIGRYYPFNKSRTVCKILVAATELSNTARFFLVIFAPLSSVLLSLVVKRSS